MTSVTATDINIAMGVATVAIKNAALVAPTVALNAVTTAENKGLFDWVAAKDAATAATARYNANATATTVDSLRYTTVGMLYLGALNRSGTYAELKYHRDDMAINGQTEDQIAANFLNSPEGQGIYPIGTTHTDNVNFVKQVYQIVFKRAYDEGGLSYWTSALDGGQTHGHVLLAMMNGLLGYNYAYIGSGAVPADAAAEFQHKADFRQRLADELAAAVTAAAGNTSVSTASARANADLTADKADVTAANAATNAAQQATTVASQQYTQVTQLYRAILNRGENIAEANYYVDLLKSGQTLVQIAQMFLNSAEAQPYYPSSGQSNDAFINQVYLFVFGRSADASGKSFWGGKLTSGQSRAQVLVDIMNSMVNYTGTDKGELGLKAAFYQKIYTALSTLEGYAQSAADPLTVYNAAVAAASTAARNAATTYDSVAAALAANPAAQARLLTTRMYVLLFNRAPTFPELNSWAAQIEGGTTITQAATTLLGTAEGLALYPTSQTNAAFITKMYQTSLGRSPSTTEKSSTASKGQIVANLVSSTGATSITAYSGTDASPLASRDLFTDKVLNALADLKNTAALYAAAADDAAGVLDKPMPDLMLKDAWSATSTGAVPLASEQPIVSRKFDRWGNLLEVTDARNAITKYEYNVFNQVTLLTDALARKTSYFYDAAGRNVAVEDARKDAVTGKGNINGKVYDAMGNVVAEKHADGGTVNYRLNAFGETILERQENGVLTAHGYDKLGRLTSTTRGAGQKFVAYHGVKDSNNDFYINTDLDKDANGNVKYDELTETYAYDELGRRVLTRAADGTDTTVRYDARGNVTETNQAGRITKYEYNAWGIKTKEVQAYNTGDQKILTWGKEGVLDMWGRALESYDVANYRTKYEYNGLGQLTQQTSDSRGNGAQNLSYTYDATSGLLVKIEDKSRIDEQIQVTQYAYDAAGNRIREKTSLQHNGIETDVAQDNHITHDLMGCVSTINDSRYSVSYEYDENGNRTHVHTRYRTPKWDATTGLTGTDEPTEVHSWNAYDVMNRQTIVDGIKLPVPLVGGIVVIGRDGDKAVGQQIAYDSAGNRMMVRQGGKRLIATTYFFKGYISQINWDTQADYAIETYGYDGAGRLTDTWRDGLDVQALRYDRASRVVQSSPTGATMSNNLRDTMAAAGISPDTQISGYNAQGQLLEQSVRDWEGTLRTHLNNGYNNLGQLTNYDQHIRGNGGYLGQYTLTYEAWDASKVKSIVGKRDGNLNAFATTSNVYDANGHLIKVNADGGDNATNAVNTRQLFNDASGRVLRKLQRDKNLAKEHATHTLIANNEVIGSSSDSGAPVSETFRSSFAPTTSASLVNGPQAYTVQRGDSLQSIAKALWGDANLWYVIADANGISSVQEGNVITIPNKPNTIYNDSQVFKPYNPGEAVGDTTPVLPTPKPKKSSWFKQLIVAIVAVVASIFLGPQMMMLAQGVLGTGLAGTVAGLALGGAAVSVVSQGVAVAIGAQDKFSWKQVGLAALSAGVTGGVGSGGSLIQTGSAVGNAMVNAAVNSFVGQGIGVVTGLQKSFSWKAVAANAAAAGAMTAVGDSIFGVEQHGPVRPGEQLPRIGGLVNAMGGSAGAQNFGIGLQRFAGAVAQGAVNGGRIDVGQLVAQGFASGVGNALGSGGSDGGYDDTWRSQNLARMRGLAAETSAGGGVDWGTSTSAMGAGPSAALPSMYPALQLVGSGQNAQGLGYYEWGNEEGVAAIATQVPPQNDLVPVGLPPLSVQGTGLRFADGRSSAYSYWSDVQDAGATQGSFLKYAFGGTMRTLSGVGYDIWDAAVGAEQNPSYLFSGSGKGAVNFGPELFNGAANALKTSLNGYSLIAERLGAGEGAFAGFRGSDPYNIAPLYSYDNKTEAGAALLTNFAMAGGAAKYGSYAIELDAASAGTLSANSLGLKLVAPAAGQGLSGPVVFRAPAGATAEEIANIRAYVEGSNEALRGGYLSPTGRVSTAGELRTDASLTAAQERARALAAGAPYGGHVGHVPDATWTGTAQPYRWQDLSPRVNQSLGAQARHYPLGYKPTEFIFKP